MVWRSVCAPWVSLWVWLLMGVKVARLVGDGVAVVVCPDVVRDVVAHGVKLLRSGRGCVHLPGLKLARVLRSITSLAPYIYNR